MNSRTVDKIENRGESLNTEYRGIHHDGLDGVMPIINVHVGTIKAQAKRPGIWVPNCFFNYRMSLWLQADWATTKHSHRASERSLLYPMEHAYIGMICGVPVGKLE